MKHILLSLCIVLISYCTIAQTFTFKYNENENPVVFFKTGDVYVQFKTQTSFLEKEIFLKSLTDNDIQIENINENIIKLRTSVNGLSREKILKTLSNEIILCSSDELIYPNDSTIQWAGNDIFVQLKNGVEMENLLKLLPISHTGYYNWNKYNDREYIVSIGNYDAPVLRDLHSRRQEYKDILSAKHYTIENNPYICDNYI